jgi:hypothetical protein
MASRPPLRGYNHNIRYRNRVYHVQTEDSGLENPRVFSHLFHGGVIIGSERTDYNDVVKEQGHEPKVQKRMQEQHKSLMKRLRRGEFDEKIALMLGTLDGEPDDKAKQAKSEAADDSAAEQEDGKGPLDKAAAEIASSAADSHSDLTDAEGTVAEAELAMVVQTIETAPIDYEEGAANDLDSLASLSQLDAARLDAAQLDAAQLDAARLDAAQLDAAFDDRDERGPAATDADLVAPDLAGPDREDKRDTDRSRAAVSASPLEKLASSPHIDLADIPSTAGAPEVLSDRGLAEPPPVPIGSSLEDLQLMPVQEELAEPAGPAWLSEDLRRQLNEPHDPAALETGEPLHPEAPLHLDEADSAERDVSVTARYATRQPASPILPDLGFKLRMGAGSRTHAEQREEVTAIPDLPNVIVEQRAKESPGSPRVIIDRPVQEADDYTTSYSHVRKGQEPGPSGVFEKPLPEDAQSHSDLLPRPVAPQAPAARRAQTQGPMRAPGQQPPRASGAGRSRPVASSPQRYVAPSAKKGASPRVVVRRRRATGSYEAARPAPGQPPGQPPRAPASPPAAPGVRPPAAPAGGPAVVARPAVMLSKNEGRQPRQTQTRASGGSGSSSGVSIAAKGPPVPMAPAKPGVPPRPPQAPRSAERPSRQTPRVRSRSLPNLFGSDLISERSLDEVILHYLAEDGESKE